MSNPHSLWCDGKALFDAQGRCFDPSTLQWTDDKALTTPIGREMTPEEALRWLQKESGTPIRPPVAVVGPREPTPEALATARAVGQDLAELGLTVLCGGRQGVMEAVCRGVSEKGGISVGLIPDGEWTSANPYVTVPIATGIGIARNALISRAALVMIAIEGGHGTLSEIAFALQFEKKVFTLCNAPIVEGAHAFADWATLKPVLCRAVFGLQDTPC